MSGPPSPSSPLAPRLAYKAFEPRIEATTLANHVPLIGAFELTYRCNFDCVHCYEQDVRDQNELDGDRWCQIIDEITELGCLFLTLTGGEAIIHPDFERIYEHAVRRGLLVTVFSNGSTLTERIARLFQRLPPRSLEVTLYGFSPETYARSTGRARNFAQAMEGIQRVLALGLKVQIKTVVFDETAGDFDAMRAFAASVGQDFRFDTNLHAAIGGGRAPLDHRLTPEAIVALEGRDDKSYDDVRARLGTPRAAASERLYRCGAGRFAFTVPPDGHLQLCSLVRSLRFDLAKVGFSQGWRALQRETERRYSSVDRRCSTCEIRHMCGTCPGVAELETGDPEAAIDHICETTHARASAILGRPIVPAWKKYRPAKLRVLGQGDVDVRPPMARPVTDGAPGSAPASGASPL